MVVFFERPFLSEADHPVLEMGTLAEPRLTHEHRDVVSGTGPVISECLNCIQCNQVIGLACGKLKQFLVYEC